MLLKFTQELNRKFDLIKKNLGSRSANTQPQISIKAISEIQDRSNNTAEDFGRNIDELLEAMVLPKNAQGHLKERYQNIQAHLASIKYYTKEQILDSAVKLRGNINLGTLDIDLVIALMDRANKIVTGYELRPAQILSVLEFFREKDLNKFCQINTGEGKTTVTSAIAVIKTLQGETVDIITSNEILAQDAIRARSDFYALFNITVAHNNADQEYSSGIRDCYAHDIVYGTIGNFEFDYLRHKTQLSNIKGARKFGALIIDEADNVVLDNATSSTKTSEPVPGMEALKYVYINIWQELINAEQALGLKNTELTSINLGHRESIKQQINKSNITSKSIVPKFLEGYVDRKLDNWINNAIHARYDYHQNQHYIIDKKDVEQQNLNSEESIIPLDVAVGVTQQNMVWTGLHPFVQIKHNMQITPDSLSSVFIANSEYIRLYNSISGLTGTLGSKEEQEVIKTLYKANSTIIPLFKASKMEHKVNLLVGNDQWQKAVADDAIDHALNQARATLVVCNTMQDVLELEEKLKTYLTGTKGINVITYRDEHDAYKIEEINKGTGIEPGTIVIATNIGGRGTDIKLSNEVIERGGLHECTTFIASSRILKQAHGRAGRQGEPGSARIIIKQHDVEELGINLKSNFSNQDIYDVVDKINNERILKFIPQIKRAESDGKYFAKFADLYTEGKSLKINHFILEDLKLQWALAFDERNDAKINDLFTKFKTAINKTGDYEHQFINQYFAVNYAEFILAVESRGDKEEDISLSYDKARQVLNQSSITEDSALLYASNMKLFELTISLAHRHELKRLASNTWDSLAFTEAQEYKTKYKGQAKTYLENAQIALTKRLKYLEDIIISNNFQNIILPQDSLNDKGANCMLKHLESQYAASQLQLQHANILIELINNSGDEFVYISAQHSLNELIEKIGSQVITNKICKEELAQTNNLGEGCFSSLKTFANITENNPKVQAAMNQVARGFAESTLNLPSFTRLPSSTHDTLIGSSIFDIMKIIFSSEETNQQAKTEHPLFDVIALDFAKLIENLNILHRVGNYVSKEISQVVSNSKLFAKVVPKVTEKLEIFEENLAIIEPKALIKAPKTLVPKKSVIKKPFSAKFNLNDQLNQALEGNDTTKDTDIEKVDAYFGKYTLGAIKNILKLRIKDAEVDKINNVKITDNNYLFIDKGSNNIQELLDELLSFTESAIVLVPLSLSNKHAVGMICFIDHNENETYNQNKSNLKIYYIDSENHPIPTELDQIFKYNQLDIEQLTTETQRYANCGPEVIENFMLYLTGERLSQAAAIPYHSLLVEQDLLQNCNNASENQAKQTLLYSVDNDSTSSTQIINRDVCKESYGTRNILNSKQADENIKDIGIMGLLCSTDHAELELSLAGLLQDFAVDDIA